MVAKPKENQSITSTLKSYVPILDWFPKYDRSWLRWDIIAALTVWALLVPEGMAYAGIAGMPPETGLYAAILALIGYALFGTSRHLNVSPSSTVAALSFATVAPMAAAGSGEFFTLTILLALLSGLILVISGFLRLGVLADFLSKPVLGGFVIGLAISIAMGQLGKILGFDVAESNFIPDIILIIRDIGMTHIPTLVVGVVSLAVLFLMQHFTPKIPAAITVVIASIVLSALLDFEAMGIHIVGEIPAGLPPIGLPEGITIEGIVALLPGAAAIALVGFAESVAAARSYASKYGYEIDANQEMIAQGVANLGSGISQGFSVDGSLSKTAAADAAGAKSQMVSLLLAVFTIITVLFLTPLFRTLPEATLGAIVIHAVSHLIDFKKLQRYYHIKPVDFWAAMTAMAGVLMLGILEGLLLAVFLSIVALLAATKNPATAILGKSRDDNTFRSLENYPEGITYPGLIIFRFDARLFFANAPNFDHRVRDLVAENPDTKWVLVDAESMNDIDITGVDMLEKLNDELAKIGVELHFARLKVRLRGVMQRAGLDNKIGKDRIHATVRNGVEAYLGSQPEPPGEPVT